MSLYEKTPLAGGVLGKCCPESGSHYTAELIAILERLALAIEGGNAIGRETNECLGELSHAVVAIANRIEDLGRVL